jgi:hypothetical protein
METMNTMKATTSAVTNTVADMARRTMARIQENPGTIFTFVFIALILIALLVTISIVVKNNSPRESVRRSNTSSMVSKLDAMPVKIAGLPPNDARSQYNLRDYFIKTSYNSCLNGPIRGGYVDTDALIAVIKHGARVLDFEVFAIDGKAVIAASDSDSFDYKSTLNAVDFAEAMDIVKRYALSGSGCPNYSDPLILHFRIKSTQPEVYDQMADTLRTNFSSELLGPSYSYESNGENFGAEPVKGLIGKVIIAVDARNAKYRSTKLDEFVNFTTGSQIARIMTDNEVQYSHSTDELTEYNKKYMTLTTPTPMSGKNSSANLHMKYGCQMIGMNFSLVDSNLKYYCGLFNDTGFAYILKPEDERYVVVTIPEPTPQDPKLSYARKTVEKPYFKMSI